MAGGWRQTRAQVGAVLAHIEARDTPAERDVVHELIIRPLPGSPAWPTDFSRQDCPDALNLWTEVSRAA
jgi:hypothetical protein